MRTKSCMNVGSKEIILISDMLRMVEDSANMFDIIMEYNKEYHKVLDLLREYLDISLKWVTPPYFVAEKKKRKK